MNQPKTFVIVNPVASNGKVGRQWPCTADGLLAAGLQFEAVHTERPLHATQLAREAMKAGYRHIVAVGGDGTLNEVVNGLVDDGQVNPEVVLSLIPSGTGADFRKTVGIPHTTEGAIACACGTGERVIDLGEMVYMRGGQQERRYFANVAGLGFDGEVWERVNPSTKILGGTIPYLVGLFATLVSYQNKEAEVQLDGAHLHQRVNSIVVCNGRYFGGGMYVGPNAVLDDGMFDVIVIGDVSKAELIANLPRIYRGTHLTHPKVDAYRSKEVTVTSRERMLLQAEGELIGETPVSFRVIPRALRVKV
ncbi:MAG: diacylglycerol kinase family lipid kinase [Chloroflexi bacterium]|nr:diacylglycerol kinase family lipid kinase [Chloroflexota bacterium]